MPKIISVHSFRHGTGKSNLTANLAYCIASQGQRVGILDTDVQSPGIHTLFGLDEGQVDSVLNYYLWGDTALGDITQGPSPILRVEQGEIAVMGGEVYLIPPSIKVREVAHLLSQGYDPVVLSRGIVDLGDRLKLDYLFIDTHPGLNQETLLSLSFCDVLVLVLGLDHQDFQGTAVLTDIARKLEVPQIFLVANQVLSSFQPDRVRQQLEEAYAAPVVGVLPVSQDMLVLASSDVFCRRYPEHALTQQMQAIAQQIIDSTAKNLLPLAIAPESAADPAPGLRMLDLLTMPDGQRRLLSWMIRQGSVTLAEAVQYLQQDAEIVESILGNLIENELIKTTESTGELQYKPRIVAKPRSKISQNFWKTLDE